MKRKIYYLMIGFMMVLAACSDLEVSEKDSIFISSGGDFLGVNATGTLQAGYNALDFGNSQEILYSLSVATTDELFIPTRGTDWGDNGVWRALATHNVTPSHKFNYDTWNRLNQGVYRANQILHEATTKTDQQAAEAKFLRAFNMFFILDLWGQVPFRDADEGPEIDPVVMKGQEVVDFIETDLLEALPDLPVTLSGDIDDQVKASKAAAHFMLAKLYLNKHIYIGAAVATADMDKVIDEIDAIEADGYELQAGFFGIFSPSADSETIFWVNAQYANRIWGSLHYNQGRETDWTSGGWNGFATTADFYSKFEGPAATNNVGDGQEERRGFVPDDALGIGFLIGTQFGPDGSDPDTDGDAVIARSGDPLVFTNDIESLTGQTEATGVRLLKYHPTINMPGTWGNHLILMRYADAYLMKMEALFRNGSVATAQTMLDDLRTLRGASALVISEQVILDERGRELYIEGWRRNDLVRFGQYNTAFGFVEVLDPFTTVFPIPEVAVSSNPNLVQNEGY